MRDDLQPLLERIDSLAARAKEDEQSLLLSFLSEFGELAEEIKIKYMNKSTKVPGPDGVAGELVDVFICLYALAKARDIRFQFTNLLLKFSPPIANMEWVYYFMKYSNGSYNLALNLIYNAYVYENSSDSSFEQYMSAKLDKWESKLK